MGATAAIAAGSLVGAYMQSEVQRAEGAYTQRMSRINARRAEIMAEDTIKKGDQEASNYGKKVKELTGSQKASLAAQGIDLGFGTAADIISVTEEQGADNIKAIKNNAFREAMGYKTKASDERIAGDFGKSMSDVKANLTILSGGLDAVKGAQKNTGGF